jgi:hypothetical protein
MFVDKTLHLTTVQTAASDGNCLFRSLDVLLYLGCTLLKTTKYNLKLLKEYEKEVRVEPITQMKTLKIKILKRIKK